MENGMEFSCRTKMVLAESIKELMRTIPLDKITVKEIVENCGTTRQTFYRNFKDKYDLVNWYFDRIIQKTIKQMGVSLTLEEGLIKKFEYMLEDKYFFISSLRSEDYNNLMKYDYKCLVDFYKSIAESSGEVNDEINFLIEFYCHGSMDMTAQWVMKGMKTSPRSMATLLIEAMPVKLDSYLKNLYSRV
ncbi:MAG: TetR/AcrR family transcriptional regulator C-terminal domain-containing protein [Lachnospiraceae bacterium]